MQEAGCCVPRLPPGPTPISLESEQQVSSPLSQAPLPRCLWRRPGVGGVLPCKQSGPPWDWGSQPPGSTWGGWGPDESWAAVKKVAGATPTWRPGTCPGRRGQDSRRQWPLGREAGPSAAGARPRDSPRRVIHYVSAAPLRLTQDSQRTRSCNVQSLQACLQELLPHCLCEVASGRDVVGTKAREAL